MAEYEWKLICCPVDSSEAGRNALRLAIDLCRSHGSELVLLDVPAWVELAEVPSTGSTDALLEDWKLPSTDAIEALLEAWKRQASRCGVRRVTVARGRGPAEIAIVEFATASGVDLIVMRTDCGADREGTIRGSVAEAVVRNAGCPVLLVNANAELPERLAPELPAAA